MGVPRLFPWIKETFSKGRNASYFDPEKYKGAITHFAYGEKKMYIDMLFFDANGLLHSAAQKVFAYGDNKPVIDIYEGLDFESKINETYKLFFDNLVRVTEAVVPTEVLYIAIDGPAPIAKQNQQRQRRMLSDYVSGFDKNSITPGTEFMDSLNDYISFRIRKEMSSRVEWAKLDVYYSSSLIPGEGEHKIMDFIRAAPKRKSMCMFGPDADLIMLTLAAHKNSMFLLREDDTKRLVDGVKKRIKPGELDYLNMSLIAEHLPKEMGITRSVYDSTNDFILLGFFVGNDFLPRIQMFQNLEEGLSKMIKVYESLYKHFPLTVRGKINFDGLKQFINKIEVSEEEFLVNQTDSNRKLLGKEYINHTLIDSITEKIAGDQLIKRLDFGKYRKVYYEKVGIFNSDQSAIDEVCEEYLKTLVWIYDYYLKGISSWDHSYKHHYAPLMFDLKGYINKLSNLKLLSKFEIGEPNYPFEQLLSVLPPSSSHLLPLEYGLLLTDSTSPLVKAGYYPDNIRMDCEGKHVEHECVPYNLPFVDSEFVKKVVRGMGVCYETAHPRNRRGILQHFKYMSGYNETYQSKYGELYDIHIKLI